MARKPAFISHSPEREAVIQSRLLNVLEARFRRKIASVVADESRRYLTAYQDLGYIPAQSDEDVAEFRRLYEQMGLETVRTFGARVVSQGKALGYDIEAKQEGGFAALFRSLALLWVNQEAIRRRITRVTETTRNQIVSQVAKGQRDGLGVAEIARNISKSVNGFYRKDPKTGEKIYVAGISQTRGALIARTETHGAANFAMHETAKTTGLELEKEWVSTEDARTRNFGDDAEYDHVSMHGQKRAMDEPFSMPWSGGPDLLIMYPGEAGKPGAAVINCRCASIQRVVGLDDEAATSVAAQSAAQGRPMTMEQAIAARPILSNAYAGSLDAAPELAARFVAKAPDINGMISGKKGAYATHDRKISMGRHVKGSPEYARVFRHEFGHTVDRELGAVDGKLFKSFDAIQDLAKDTAALEARRTGMFMGDRDGSAPLRKQVSKNRSKYSDERVALIKDADVKGFANDAKAVIENMTPLKYDDVLKLYDVTDISPNVAFDFAAAWKQQDAYELLHGIGVTLKSRPTHKSAFAGMQDTFEAGTAGKIRISFGHGEKYYKDRLRAGPKHKEGRRTFGYGSTAEAFANWFEAYASPNKADYQMFQMLWPRTSRSFEKMLEVYADG